MQAGYLNLFLKLAVTALLLVASPAMVDASAGPGDTVRNAFGPQAGKKANQCRGACGSGCPKTCARTVTYECADAEKFRRVETYDCGTHQGCRVHDDCLDACPRSGPEANQCAQRCDAEALERYGFEAGSWMIGQGPYDGRIQFEYTRDAPGASEPMYRCPDGARRQCGDRSGCMVGNDWVEPVFDAYAGGRSAMRVENFSAGPDCGNRVCKQQADIKITGSESCYGNGCTRFGMEFDYRNANPSAPLECTSSTSGGGSDFIGDLLKQGADAMESRDAAPDPESEDGMEALMGLFGAVLTSADSPDDVNISMAPLGEDGKPIESQRVGTAPRGGLPPTPDSVDLPAGSGHLFVPLYHLAKNIEPGQTKERRVRCTHQGNPVLDTTFRLHGQ